MIIHTENIGQVKAVCDHFSIPINTAELELSFPWAFPLKTVRGGEPLNDDNEYTFGQFEEKYLNEKP